MEILTHVRGLGSGRRGWVIGRTATLGFVIALGNCFADGPPQQIDEYQVKAAFIYNFAKFVQWPAGAFQGPNEPIAICLLGEDPFGRSLEDTVAGRVIEGRSFVVRHISNLKQVEGCKVLFVSAKQDKHVPATLADIRLDGILTIGESDVPGGDGVVINFRVDNGKVRFDINVEAAEREKLRISSRLLSLAHVVETNKK
jgi:hypothetical protein